MSTELCPTCGGGKWPGREVSSCTNEFHGEKTWKRIQRPRCDTCNNLAVWAHPLGGLRCKTCLRTPETKR